MILLEKSLLLIKKSALLFLKFTTERFLVRGQIGVTLSTLYGWRYPIFLIRAFARTTVVGIHWKDVDTARKMLGFKNFLFRTRIASLVPKSARGVLLLDDFNVRIEGAANISKIDKRYFATEGQDNIFHAPYFAHPLYYERNLRMLSRQLLSKSLIRKYRLFFSGTVNEAHYETLRLNFSLMTRGEIIGELEAYFRDERGCSLRRRSLINCTRAIDSNGGINFHPYTLEEYLEKLSESDFVVCPPGWAMPLSHNIVECMSVGAIPITNYASFLVPRLENGVNCMTFDTRDDLSRVLDKIANMNNKEIELIRCGVISYYLRFLDEEAAGFRMFEAISNGLRIAINDESGR